MQDALNWFEIPAVDFERAVNFYNEIMETTLIPFGDSLEEEMAVFPAEQGRVSGAVIRSDWYKPSLDGAVIYLACEDVADVAARVAAAGGQVLREKYSIGPHGFVAIIQDSEGNRIGLHSTA